MPRKSNKKNKKNKTLSKKNINTKTSAKSQAKQINALNKKIKRVYREVAPEVQTFNKTLINIGTLPNGTNIKSYDGVIGVYKDMFDTTSTTSYTMKGNMMRVRNVILYGSFAFNRGLVSVQRQDVNIGMSYHYIPYVAYMRLIICRLKKGSSYNLPPKITQNINPNASADGTVTDLSLINGPLIDNVASSLTIIKQKIIKINCTNPCKMFKIKLGSSLIHKNALIQNHFDSNEILIYYQYVCPNVLKIDDPTSPIYNVGPTTHFTLNYKVAFTDDA